MRATVNLLAIALTALFAAATASPAHQERVVCILGGNVTCNNNCIDSGHIYGYCVDQVCVCYPQIFEHQTANSRGKIGDGRYNSKMAPNDVMKSDPTCAIGGNHQCNNLCIDRGALSGSCVNLQCVCDPEVYNVQPHNRRKAQAKMAANDVISQGDATCSLGGNFHCANACIDTGAMDGSCVDHVCVCMTGWRIVASWSDRLCVTPESRSASCEMTCRLGHIRATTGSCGNSRCNCLQRP